MVILATHNIFQVGLPVDRVGFLLKGELIELRSAKEVLTQPNDMRTSTSFKGEVIYQERSL